MQRLRRGSSLCPPPLGNLQVPLRALYRVQAGAECVSLCLGHRWPSGKCQS